MGERFNALNTRDRIVVIDYVTARFKSECSRAPSDNELYDRCEAIAKSSRNLKRITKYYGSPATLLAEMRSLLNRERRRKSDIFTRGLHKARVATFANVTDIRSHPKFRPKS